MQILTSSIGRKVVMAATGQVMIIFILFHVSGNSSIYFGTLNAYAAALHTFPLIVWAVRLLLLAVVSLHIYYAIQLTLENSEARPQPYLRQVYQASTLAGRNMIWTGAVIGSFLAYHLLHFTVQATNPSFSAYKNLDAAGKPDVFLMVLRSFQNPAIAAVYIISVAALGLHLFHGIQSSFQTWGLNSERTFPCIRAGGTVASVIVLLAYAAIPVVILTGLLKQ
jgi:succinate dehydrogenase / fumarate reductase cytochrome b subunit